MDGGPTAPNSPSLNRPFQTSEKLPLTTPSFSETWGFPVNSASVRMTFWCGSWNVSNFRDEDYFIKMKHVYIIVYSLSIQVCPKKGINPTILLWGWDWNPQSYSREGYGSLGIVIQVIQFVTFWSPIVGVTAPCRKEQHECCFCQ